MANLHMFLGLLLLLLLTATPEALPPARESQRHFRFRGTAGSGRERAGFPVCVAGGRGEEAACACAVRAGPISALFDPKRGVRDTKAHPERARRRHWEGKCGYSCGETP